MTTKADEMPDVKAEAIICDFCDEPKEATGLCDLSKPIMSKDLLFAKDENMQIFICEECVKLANSICEERDFNCRTPEASVIDSDAGVDCNGKMETGNDIGFFTASCKCTTVSALKLIEAVGKWERNRKCAQRSQPAQDKQESDADAARALEDYVGITGLTPMDEQKEIVERFYKHLKTIRACLSSRPETVSAESLKLEFINRLDGSDRNIKAFATGLIQGVIDCLADSFPNGLVITKGGQ